MIDKEENNMLDKEENEHLTNTVAAACIVLPDCTTVWVEQEVAGDLQDKVTAAIANWKSQLAPERADVLRQARSGGGVVFVRVLKADLMAIPATLGGGRV